MIVNRHYCRNNQGEKDSEIKPPLKGTSFCPEYKGSKKKKKHDQGRHDFSRRERE